MRQKERHLATPVLSRLLCLGYLPEVSSVSNHMLQKCYGRRNELTKVENVLEDLLSISAAPPRPLSLTQFSANRYPVSLIVDHVRYAAGTTRCAEPYVASAMLQVSTLLGEYTTDTNSGSWTDDVTTTLAAGQEAFEPQEADCPPIAANLLSASPCEPAAQGTTDRPQSKARLIKPPSSPRSQDCRSH